METTIVIPSGRPVATVTLSGRSSAIVRDFPLHVVIAQLTRMLNNAASTQPVLQLTSDLAIQVGAGCVVVAERFDATQVMLRTLNEGESRRTNTHIPPRWWVVQRHLDSGAIHSAQKLLVECGDGTVAAWPFANVYQTGTVCWGEIAPVLDSATGLDKQFLESAFNNDLVHIVRSANLVESLRGWTGQPLAMALQGAVQYPVRNPPSPATWRIVQEVLNVAQDRQVIVNEIETPLDPQQFPAQAPVYTPVSAHFQDYLRNPGRRTTTTVNTTVNTPTPPPVNEGDANAPATTTTDRHIVNNLP